MTMTVIRRTPWNTSAKCHICDTVLTGAVSVGQRTYRVPCGHGYRTTTEQKPFRLTTVQQSLAILMVEG